MLNTENKKIVVVVVDVTVSHIGLGVQKNAPSRYRSIFNTFGDRVI